ncbi:MAG: hypothetical protein KAR40_09140 [Candidatus Sabulitectum sp.]|nr:hypothetical protein [Candidatus Sabulitectum sp.]
MNLLIGTGVSDGEYFHTGDPDVSGEGSLPTKFSELLNLRDPSLMQHVRSEADGIDVPDRNELYTSSAVSLWKENTLKLGIYGVAKILHGFGFSLRGIRDVITLGFTLLALVCSIILWKKNKYQIWCTFFWLSTTILSGQMFFFLPNQRFKTVIFDPVAILIISLLSGSILLKLYANWRSMRKT